MKWLYMYTSWRNRCAGKKKLKWYFALTPSVCFSPFLRWCSLDLFFIFVDRLDETYRKDFAEYQVKEREWKQKNEEMMQKMSEMNRNQKSTGIESEVNRNQKSTGIEGMYTKIYSFYLKWLESIYRRRIWNVNFVFSWLIFVEWCC